MEVQYSPPLGLPPWHFAFSCVVLAGFFMAAAAAMSPRVEVLLNPLLNPNAQPQKSGGISR